MGSGDPSVVYARCMARTNIDLDEELVAEVMRRFGLHTKREAIDLALRRLVGVPLTPQFVLELEGVGWMGDLDEMRATRSDSPGSPHPESGH
jgi:Arc/MetJ family transcription regulator